jgi:hypothetical protein
MTKIDALRLARAINADAKRRREPISTDIKADDGEFFLVEVCAPGKTPVTLDAIDHIGYALHHERLTHAEGKTCVYDYCASLKEN